jgi:hypothetical protein
MKKVDEVAMKLAETLSSDWLWPTTCENVTARAHKNSTYYRNDPVMRVHSILI